MQNLSDRELDDTFKKANAEQKFPYEEAAWKELDARLSATHRTAWTKWKNALLITGIMLIGSVTSFVVLSPFKELPFTITERTSAKTGEIISSDVQAEKGEVLVKEKYPSNLLKTTKKKSGNRNRIEPIFIAAKPHKMITSDTANSSGVIQLLGIEIKESNKQPTTYPPLSNDNVLQVPTLSETIVKDSTTVVKREDKEEKKQNQVSLSKVAVRIFVSPDFSANNFSTVGKTGINYGFSIEYFLRDRLSLSLGLVQSRKYYEASDVTYSYRTAEFMEGDCRIWDLPLNATYYFSLPGNTSFYTSTGFTSYLMKKENYDYYPNADNRNYKYSQEIKGKNKEWFSVLNVSVGLQTQITKSWSVQAEPFMKVPLTGIGEGNVSLSSFGAFLGLKYQFKNTL